jgi:hypothetical protein
MSKQISQEDIGVILICTACCTAWTLLASKLWDLIFGTPGRRPQNSITMMVAVFLYPVFLISGFLIGYQQSGYAGELIDKVFK